MATEHLLTYQQENRQRTAHAVAQAIGSLEAEIEAGLVDPATITKRTVADRAGIGRSSLKNESQRHTRTVVDNWIASLAKPLPEAPKSKAPKLAFPDLARHLDVALLELEALRSERAALISDHVELQSKLARTERELAEARRTPHLKSI